ncbi:MAG: PTS transporter subunit EIIB [Gammaproteobacteria bacterium]|nr:PTS transporter subunit EIIB [Gammaproteobacteria bacterium]
MGSDSLRFARSRASGMSEMSRSLWNCATRLRMVVRTSK